MGEGKGELVQRLTRVDLEPLRAARGEYLRAAEALKKRGFEARYCETVTEAAEAVLGLVPAGARVGVGGSLTIRELGVLETLGERGHEVIHLWYPNLSREENVRLRREELTSDVFLTSANAVTLKGQLVNVDGVGNRVGAMAFGPARTVVVAGANKVVRDVDEGLERIKRVAAPLNCIRYAAKTPCAVTGVCTDCDSPDRICVVYSIIDRRPMLSDVAVIMVGEELGY